MIGTVELGSVLSPELHRCRVGSSSTLCGKELTPSFVSEADARVAAPEEPFGECTQCRILAKHEAQRRGLHIA